MGDIYITENAENLEGIMDMLGPIMGAIGVLYGFVLLLSIVLIVAQWKIFVKADEEGWKSLIPFYNQYIIYKLAWGNGWYFLLQLIPCVGWIFPLIFSYKLAKSFGGGFGMTIGLILFPAVFYCILAFGSSQYIGPPQEAF